MTEPLISLRGVGFAVERPVPTRILHPLDLEVDAGASVAIIGPSGAGKTTLASIIGALQPASEGVYRAAGSDITALDQRGAARFRRDSVGFVFQQSHLIDERSAWRNVALGLSDPDIPPAEVEERSRTALERVGLADIADREATLLSGGERHRVATARAIVSDPPILLADEPTAALDQATGDRILDLLFGLVDAKRALLVVSHDQRAADRADRTVSIVDGRANAQSAPVVPAGGGAP